MWRLSSALWHLQSASGNLADTGSLRPFLDAFAGCRDSSARQRLFSFIINGWDLDDPSLQDLAFAAMQMSMGEPANESMSIDFDFFRFRMLLDNGRLTSVDAFEFSSEASRSKWRLPFKLIADFAHGREQTLQADFNALTADQLKEPETLDDLLMVARELPQGALYADILFDGYAADVHGKVIDLIQGSTWSLSFLFNYAYLAGPERFEYRWLAEALGERSPNPVLQTNTKMLLATLDKDWTAVERHAKALVNSSPKHWGLYWHLGHAQLKLGREIEAQEALGKFVRQRRSSPQCREAMVLLSSLEMAETVAKGSR